MATRSTRDEVTAPGSQQEPTGPVDEVGVDLGPDGAARGLLDSWAGRTSPGELTQGEATGALAAEELPLTAVLARVAASLGRADDAARLAGARGQPSRAVKALIADEPLDPLPVPDGLSPVGAGFLDEPSFSDITAVGRRPGERELALAAARAGLPADPPATPAVIADGPRHATPRIIALVALLLLGALLLVASAALVLRGR